VINWCFIGVDPGLEGAIAVIRSEDPDHPHLFDMPIKQIIRSGEPRNRVDPVEFGNVLDCVRANLGFTNEIAVEDIWDFGQAMRGRGGTVQRGQFSFAEGYGAIKDRAETKGLKVVLVPPQTWMRGVGRIPGQDKELSILRAQQLYPEAPIYTQKQFKNGKVKRTYKDGRADALLIAHWLRLNRQPKTTQEKEELFSWASAARN
jgi:hypothetical protein